MHRAMGDIGMHLLLPCLRGEILVSDMSHCSGRFSSRREMPWRHAGWNPRCASRKTAALIVFINLDDP